MKTIVLIINFAMIVIMLYITMLQKIRELICMGANMDHFPKKDKEYEKISILICKKSKEKTELNINTLKSLLVY